MKLVEIATRRRVAIGMLSLTLVLFGLIGLSKLQVNLLPDIAYPTLTVRTEYTGAAPEEIETLLTRPIEEAVGVVKNVTRVKSVSRSGQSDVILEFAWGTDMDQAGLEVREKLEVLTLPLEASRPLLLRFNPDTDPILRMGLSFKESQSSFDETGLKQLRRFADEEIRKDLEPVEGVAAVKISGGLEDEVQILIDQRKLAQLRLSIDQLSQRLNAENVNLSAGRLEQGTQRYLVRTINQFASVQEIADLVVAPGTGRPIYLRDIATIEQGYKERQAIIRMDGVEAVEVAIYREGDANTVNVASAIHERTETLRESLPDGMVLSTIDDRSVFIRQAIGDVKSAAILGGVLAVLVIFLFLRDLRSTLIIAAAIPVSVIAAFFLMYQAGITLNIMSLGGVALATGLLVDNGIVVLENIARHRAAGLSRTQAAIRGTSEVGPAVIASTLTTVAVFFPLAFVEGIAGQMFRDQALTVTFALLVSLLVAMTLIPMLSASRGDEEGEAITERPEGRVMRTLRKPYMALLRQALAHRWSTVMVAALACVMAFMLLNRQGMELVPQLAQGEFEVTLEADPGTPLKDTDSLLRDLQAGLSQDDNINLQYAVAGSGNRIDANPTESGENIGRLLVIMRDQSNEGAENAAMQQARRLSTELPGVEAHITRPELLSFDKPLEIELVGYDLEQLKRLSEQVVARLSSDDRFVDIESSTARGHPEIQIYFDQERAAALGLTVKAISDRIVNTVRGEVATRYSFRDRKIDVLVRSEEDDRQSVDDIRNLIVNPASARPVTLSSVADVVVTEGPAEIRRSDQERVALISANLAYGDLGSAVAASRALLDDLVLPPEFDLRVTGQNEEMEQSFASLLFALGLAIFLVYLVMASQFESLMHPFVILFTLPMALVGVALSLWLTDTRLSVIVFIGLIMLAGIVVNNAIVLVDLVNQLRQAGASRNEALLEAASLRLRPILMTTMTTILGLLPMAWGVGQGAEMRTPMAIVVIGGLLVATLLTLVVIPVMYSLLDRREKPRELPAAVQAGGSMPARPQEA